MNTSGNKLSNLLSGFLEADCDRSRSCDLGATAGQEKEIRRLRIEKSRWQVDRKKVIA